MSFETITLDRLPEGSRGKVEDILLHGEMRRRLQDLGLIEGAVVRCLQKSLTGSPIAYYIRGAAIALRGDDAQHILIRME